MNLFQEFDSAADAYNESTNQLSNESKPKFESITINTIGGLQLSSLVQFFIAPLLFVNPNGIWQIPVSDTIIYDTTIREIAPHFNKIMKVTSGNQIDLMLQGLNESSASKYLELGSN